MLAGGIPRGRTVLIEGSPGTGKTILSLHFIIEGILGNTDKPERCVFVCIDEDPAELVREAMVFGWDLKRLIELKQLVIIDGFSGRLGFESKWKPALSQGEKDNSQAIIDLIQTTCETNRTHRLVIDSVSAFLDELEGNERRKAVQSLVAVLSRLSLTTLLTAELSTTHALIERYATHGLISLKWEMEGRNKRRVLEIVKMREAPHYIGYIPFTIGIKGIELTLM